MEASASTSLRDQRRRDTAERIARCARVLADERGLDGFTMDDLAAEAGVSRRTLFNYYPGKDLAVLGHHDDDVADEVVATFCAGGPTGDLIDDLRVLVDAHLEGKDIDRAEVARMRRILHHNPRLVGVFKQEFEAKGQLFCKLIEEREGEAYDDIRARVVFRTLVSLVDMCLDYYVDHPEHELAELFDRAIHALRSAF